MNYILITMFDFQFVTDFFNCSKVYCEIYLDFSREKIRGSRSPKTSKNCMD